MSTAFAGSVQALAPATLRSSGGGQDGVEPRAQGCAYRLAAEGDGAVPEAAAGMMLS